MCLRLPDSQRFIRAYIIKEALLSSQIEGIHTTLIEVFTQALEGVNKLSKDTQLVVNYTKSVDAALSIMKEENLPLVSRVILRAHEVLMSGGDGDKANPGHYCKQSVRVGELIPPPAPEVPNLMSRLEKYMNEPSDLPLICQHFSGHLFKEPHESFHTQLATNNH
jgi:Fic family protein